MPGKCSFNPKWLSDPKYKDWIAVHPTRTMVKCVPCDKPIDISNMGESALCSHAKGAKHKKHVEQKKTAKETNFRISTFFDSTTNAKSHADSTRQRESVSSTASANGVSEAVHSESQSEARSADLSCHISREDTLKAEILWTLKVVKSHYSFKSCEDVVQLFRSMFPDSEIARKMSGGERKIAYIATFGLGPHFLDLMKEKVKSSDGYVLLFDESLNDQLQKKQLDIHVRFWDGNQVSSRFCGSSFMGHATAADLLDELLPQCLDLGLQNLLQVSMDGPNVNLKLQGLLDKQQQKDTQRSLLNVGSCGIHTLHNAFRAGHAATGWDLGSWMSSLHWLFKDSPARREDLVQFTACDSFPYHYCHHRWLENVPVAERGLGVWPNIKKFVEAVKSGKISEPKNKSYKTLDALTLDVLFEAKVQAFVSIAKVVTPFMTKFQSDAPMLPFLCRDLFKIAKVLLGRCLKSTELEKINSMVKLAALDLSDASIFVAANKVDVGFVAKNILKELKGAKKISDRQDYAFHSDVKLFLVAVVKKILEKSPIRFSLARNVEWLVPHFFVEERVKSFQLFQNCLQQLSSANRVSLEDCDTIISQFRQFQEDVLQASAGETIAFKEFNLGADRLDNFWHGLLGTSTTYKGLWDIVKMLLMLSHGQATVERGFSENKELMADNMSEKTLVSMRVIVDHIKHVGGLQNVAVTRKMMMAASGARQQYQLYLDDQKQKKEESSKMKKRKAMHDEVDELKRKRTRLDRDIQALKKAADSYAEKAENKGDLTLLAKSNSMRKSVLGKEKDLEKTNEELTQKVNEMMNN